MEKYRLRNRILSALSLQLFICFEAYQYKILYNSIIYEFAICSKRG